VTLSPRGVPLATTASSADSDDASRVDAGPASVPVVDQNGDAIFRFRLDIPAQSADFTLDEFYRRQINDLLKIVRLYSGTTQVLVDGFAFRREPQRIQPLQPRTVDDSDV
jgi:hypothetical protein